MPNRAKIRPFSRTEDDLPYKKLAQRTHEDANQGFPPRIAALLRDGAYALRALNRVKWHFEQQEAIDWTVEERKSCKAKGLERWAVFKEDKVRAEYIELQRDTLLNEEVPVLMPVLDARGNQVTRTRTHWICQHCGRVSLFRTEECWPLIGDKKP